jgi:CubicO group peptidase (beta-lactamase class C family)
MSLDPRRRIAGRPFIDYVGPRSWTHSGWPTLPGTSTTTRPGGGWARRTIPRRPSLAPASTTRARNGERRPVATLDDLGLWIDQQLRSEPDLERGDGQVLRGATLAEMHRQSFISKPDWTEAQGLGWYGTRSGETILIGHSGGLWGFITNISFSPPGRVGAIVLLNGIGDADKLARELMDVALPAIREADDRAEVPPFAPIPDAWRELLGVYRDPEFASTRCGVAGRQARPPQRRP